MENKQLEQALNIIAQTVDAATASGIFKKAQEAALVAQALQIVAGALTAKEESEPKELKKVKK